jgi:hypothetical protein
MPPKPKKEKKPKAEKKPKGEGKKGRKKRRTGIPSLIVFLYLAPLQTNHRNP